MIFIISWLALCLINARIHWYVIEKKNHSPNKIIWTFIPLAALIALSALFPWTGFWWHMLAGWLMFTFFFEYPLNKWRGKPLSYQSSKGIDALQKKLVNDDDFWLLFDAFLALIGAFIVAMI